MNLTQNNIIKNQPIRNIEGASAEIKPSGGVVTNYVIAGLLVAVIAVTFILIEPRTNDWYILPAIFCGLLMGADVVSWWRGQLDLFDPKGLIGFVGFYGLFLAPILHVYWNTYGSDLNFHKDPRQWLFLAGAANGVGILAYIGGQRWTYNHTSPVKSIWRVEPSRIIPILSLVVPVALGTWFYFERLRWTSGVVGDFVASHMWGQGLGWVLIFGGQFLAVILLIGIISKTMAPHMDRSGWICAVTFFIGALGQLYLTAFAGTRGLILVGLFWIGGLIHYFWRKVSKIFLIVGVLCFLPFMYFYSFYKDFMQPKMLTSLEVIKESKQLERETGRNIHTVLLGDLARADVQARIASKVAGPESSYELRYGRTYLSTFMKVIPASLRQILFEDPSLLSWSKGKAFIELNEGKGSFDAKTNWGTRAFGLGGEAMLNFGLLGVPVAWLLFGLVLGIFRRKRDTLAFHDSRWGLVPLLSYWLAVTLLWDLDVLIFQIVVGGLMPSLCIFFWSRKKRTALI
jgi:hypothetical protein